MLTLGQVLNNSADFDSRHFLYLPMDEIWELGTTCSVLAQSEECGVPATAKENGLSYALGIAEIQDIVANVKLQTADVSASQLLEAFLFYYDHDAYIDLER